MLQRKGRTAKPHCLLLPIPPLLFFFSASFGLVVIVWRTEILARPFTEPSQRSQDQTTSDFTLKHTITSGSVHKRSRCVSKQATLRTRLRYRQREQRERMLSSLSFPQRATPPALTVMMSSRKFAYSPLHSNIFVKSLNEYSLLFSFPPR